MSPSSAHGTSGGNPTPESSRAANACFSESGVVRYDACSDRRAGRRHASGGSSLGRVEAGPVLMAALGEAIARWCRWAVRTPTGRRLSVALFRDALQADATDAERAGSSRQPPRPSTRVPEPCSRCLPKRNRPTLTCDGGGLENQGTQARTGTRDGSGL